MAFKMISQLMYGGLKKALVLCLFGLTCLVSHAQLREQAFAMNKKLSRGINMGNCFEAPSETAWGNPWKPEYFRIISELGFKHVRIPIRWEPAERSSATAPYTINQAFLNRIKQVVDTALKYKLHAIINMHHHDALIADPDGQKARFLSQWGQIAQFFRNYPDSLLFEVLNEPNGKLNAAKWNTFFPEALAEIRKTNPTRFVVLGISEWGGLSGLPNLQIPDDENLILTIHYYNPFHFTHQGAEWSDGSAAWLGTQWLDTEMERQTITGEYLYALQLSQEKHIPIHIGEFGAYSKADEASRVRWTTYLSRWFEEKGFSWAYWEFSAGFGIYAPATKKLLTPLVNALLHNTMPQPAPVELIKIYASNFTSSNDGWSVNFSQGASGSSTRSNGKLNITITNGGTDGWNVQLVKNNIPLTKGKSYRVSYTVKAVSGRTATAYTGKATDPWNAYSEYNSVWFPATEETLGYSFVMNSTSDNAARIVFDLGKSTTGFTISNIRIDEVRLLTSSSALQKENFMLYPNPVTNELNIQNSGGAADGVIINSSGQVVVKVQIQPGHNSVDTRNLPSGVYFLKSGIKGISKSYTILKY